MIWRILLAVMLSISPAFAEQLNPTPTAPAFASGYGVLSATNSSVLLSTVTAATNGNGWPTTSNVIYIKNIASSTGIFYVCPFGGTCSSSVGIAIEAGTSYTLYMKNPTFMTGVSASTSTVDLQW